MVWQGQDGSDHEIFVWKVGDAAPTKLTDNAYHDENPQVSGERIVWQRHDYTDWEILAWKVGDAAPTRLTDNTYHDENPRVSGERVVWSGFDGVDWDIFTWNAGDAVPTRITSSEYDEEAPRVSGDRIAWRGWDGTDWHIFTAIPAGTAQVPVSGSGPVGLPGGGSITFPSGTVPGVVTVTPTDPSAQQAPPSGFRIGAKAYYEMSSTALYSGTLTIVLPYDDTGLSPADEQALKLMHWVDPTGWQDITVPPVDTASNLITGTTASLSPFAVFSPKQPAIALAPAELDFGAVEIGSSKVMTVTVTNTGDATLNASCTITPTSENAVTTTLGFISLPPGDSIGVPIVFAPTAARAIAPTATLWFETNVPGDSWLGAVTLSGTGVSRYVSSGVLEPINADGGSIFKAGSTVPVKISLTDRSGAPVLGAVIRLYLTKLSDSVTGDEVEAVSTSSADSGNMLRDKGGGSYMFNLSAKGLTKGTYRLRLAYPDGTSETVGFSLK